MTHFTALVLLPPDTINIKAKVNELLSTYDNNIEVEPYREYFSRERLAKEVEYLATFSAESIENLAQWLLGNYTNDLERLAKLKLGWYEEEIDGVDEEGEYKIVTYNPQGKWDWYRFIEEEVVESGKPIPYPCPVVNLPDVIPYAIITPDGEWQELDNHVAIKATAKMLRGDTTVSEEEAEWDRHVREILASYPDYLAVALDCHI